MHVLDSGIIIYMHNVIYFLNTVCTLILEYDDMYIYLQHI